MWAPRKFAGAHWFNMNYRCINIKILADTDEPIIFLCYGRFLINDQYKKTVYCLV